MNTENYEGKENTCPFARLQERGRLFFTHGVEPMFWWVAFRLNVEGQISSLVGSMMLFGGFL